MTKNLSLLVLLACLAFSQAQAVIIYRDIDDVTLNSGEPDTEFKLDIDNDSDPEFEFSFVMGVPLILFLEKDAFVSTHSAASWDVLIGLETGTAIDNGTGWFAAIDAYIDPFWGPATYTFPTDETYVGFKFEMEGEVHYGWILIEWNGDDELVLKSYAYEDQRNTAIVTGETETIIILVTSIEISGFNGIDEMNVGQILPMSAEVLPEDATNKSITWSIENETGEATIDENGTVKGSKAGTVKVIATANDESGIKAEFTITLHDPMSIHETDMHSSLKVFPNPTNGIFNIQLNEEIDRVAIYDARGNEIQVSTPGNQQYQFDLSPYPSGIYLVRVASRFASKTIYIYRP